MKIEKAIDEIKEKEKKERWADYPSLSSSVRLSLNKRGGSMKRQKKLQKFVSYLKEENLSLAEMQEKAKAEKGLRSYKKEDEHELTYEFLPYSHENKLSGEIVEFEGKVLGKCKEGVEVFPPYIHGSVKTGFCTLEKCFKVFPTKIINKEKFTTQVSKDRALDTVFKNAGIF